MSLNVRLRIDYKSKKLVKLRRYSVKYILSNTRNNVFHSKKCIYKFFFRYHDYIIIILNRCTAPATAGCIQTTIIPWHSDIYIYLTYIYTHIYMCVVTIHYIHTYIIYMFSLMSVINQFRN